jgi:hypothetical protein
MALIPKKELVRLTTGDKILDLWIEFKALMAQGKIALDSNACREYFQEAISSIVKATFH